MTGISELTALLKRIRLRAEIGQDRLSLKAGLSETYYGKIENELRRPSGAALTALLDVLPCTAEERSEAMQLLIQSHLPRGLLGDWMIVPRPRPGPTASRTEPDGPSGHGPDHLQQPQHEHERQDQAHDLQH